MDDAEKAEKRAAVKKRAEALKKQKAKKAGGKKEEKTEAAAEGPKVDEAAETEKPATPPAETTAQDDEDEPPRAEKQEQADAAAPEPLAPDGGDETGDTGEKVSELTPARPHQRQPSISVQSKLRSSSFKQGAGPLSPGMFSPDGDTAPEIYRKQATRIEELEKENKRLAKEAADGEKRWKKAEDQLEDLRDADGDTKVASEGSSAEVEKLKQEIAALQRQNSQLQVQSSRTTRHGSSPSVSMAHAPADLEAELASKSSTIESMEIEISNLRAQLERVASGSTVEKEQIAALEDKLARSERSAVRSQQELGDLKKNLDRTTEKAVKEGSERISAETKLKTLEREAEEAKSSGEELQKKIDALEKKVSTLTTLHKEHDARSQAQKREREKVDKEAADLRARLAAAENENLRMKEERERIKKRDAQGIDDAGVDELEDEERERLEKKVRDLEAEIHELRRGVWRDRRGQIEGEESGLTSPGARFTDVDLGGMSPDRRRSSGHPQQHPSRGLSDYLTSGFNAITGAGQEDALLEDDELLDFDEDAFRAAQQEEASKRLERVKEIKRGLKEWQGWRLDLVEHRRGGGEGIGEIFEI
ncbi:hypothetical protein PVAG01_06650 [Phlyctema vagabunda]|uniref:M protein repeat protein n=1 Tax=Phlyctema vagabunda TaxID=108571 RepID=A0ABR4PGN4_9HELO